MQTVLHDQRIPIFDRVFLLESEDGLLHTTGNSSEFYWRIDTFKYVGFTDDFGPMNLGTVFQYCSILDEQLSLHPGQKLLIVSLPGPQTFTNSVFLVGAYMIMKHEVRSRS
jgi:hypothetical protein